MTLDEILNEWKKDSVIDDLNLDDESIKTSKLHAKYLEILSHYKLKLKAQKFDYDKIYKDKWSYYNGKMSKAEMDDREWDYDPFGGCTKPLKSDMDIYYNTDDELVKQKSKIEYTKTILETLEEIVGNIRWRHTHIKNMIDWRRFTAGG